MMADKPVQSAQWAEINQTCITEERLRDLDNFKSDEINYKLALWNPRTNGVRYLKALIYNLTAALGDEERKRLSRIANRCVGNPIDIRYEGESVCLDYLQAVMELSFVMDLLPLDGGRILEIGAGYGRTCHTFLSNLDLAAYTIIDLPNCLNLARRYLQSVLTAEAFQRVRFVSIDELPAAIDGSFDLCINIDSFAEMEAATVRYYLDLIDRTCRAFYVKNPVGKYDDASLTTERKNKEVSLAMTSGPLRDVLDIHDSQAVRNHVPPFLEAYRPAARWNCLAQGWAPPWSFYWQAIYGRDDA